MRSLIEDVLDTEHGGAWHSNLGVTPERIANWEERRTEAEKRAVGGAVEQRILFYADFTDLLTVITKPTNWPLFKPCFREEEVGGVS